MMKTMVEYNTLESHWITGEDGKICLALEQTTTDTGIYLNPTLSILQVQDVRMSCDSYLSSNLETIHLMALSMPSPNLAELGNKFTE